ncbi:mannosidase [Coprinopsis sp. MPI-PUGE-AT-0042]|nr:mannosidase [Coprinopsis sp. MPI-PUGE-AT-0042]
MYNWTIERTLARLQHLKQDRSTRLKLVYALLLLLAVVGLFSTVGSRASSQLFDLAGADAYIPSSVWRYRAERVKQAVQHAYRGYEDYAFPLDELRPVTGTGMSLYNGWGVTAFDSLDTLYLLGLEDEYNRALKLVERVDFRVVTNLKGTIPYFETVIRYLGGMLSAYALSKEPMLLRRAMDLADVLEPIFNSSSGLPLFEVNPKTNRSMGSKVGVLAEIASWQLEYTYLAKASGQKKYLDPVHNLNNIFYHANLSKTNGMLPIGWDIIKGVPATHESRVSVGAQADSTHEYLLKQYLLTAKTDKANLELYLHATNHILTNLLYLSPNRQLLYVTDTRNTLEGETPSHVFEHLSCFLPGLLALGAHTLPLDKLSESGIDIARLGAEARFGDANKAHRTVSGFNIKKLHLWAAEGLAQSCWLSYADQPTGLGPDEMVMRSYKPDTYTWDDVLGAWAKSSIADKGTPWIEAMESWKASGSKGRIPGLSQPVPVKKADNRDYTMRRQGYLLRPETVESFYILWKVTGDAKWRTRGWAIFEALERETKTENGYVTLKDVAWSPGVRGNSMPSFFLAETLKYLYLLFSEDDPIPIDQWVFNTEAHPFPVFSWTDEERRHFNITSI